MSAWSAAAGTRMQKSRSSGSSTPGRALPPDRGAALLVGHIAKPTASGIPTTEGYSGTPDGTMRSAGPLVPLPRDARHGRGAKRPERTGDLILELQKSNMGPATSRCVSPGTMPGTCSSAATSSPRRRATAPTATGSSSRRYWMRWPPVPTRYPPRPPASVRPITYSLPRPQFPDSLRSGKPGTTALLAAHGGFAPNAAGRGGELSARNRHATAILRLTTFGRANASNDEFTELTQAFAFGAAPQCANASNAHEGL